ncbi:MAG: hypothetical protein KDA42_15225, partial [Planctomycetales bacterium]|nr:hypothetical protein [Planctomycetales bacterium]
MKSIRELLSQRRKQRACHRGQVRCCAQLELLEHRRLLDAAPTLVADLVDGDTSGLSFNTEIVAAEDRIFVSSGGTFRTKLWVSDGTSDGTQLLYEPTSGAIDFLTPVGNNLFFRHNNDVWFSDGTVGGTVSLMNFFHPPADLTAVGDQVYFSALDQLNGRELWRSDGTTEGTQLVMNIFAFANSSSPENLVNVNGTLFFVADDGIHGREIWRSPGISAPAEMVIDLVEGPGDGISTLGQRIFLAGDNYLFFEDGSDAGISDGTAAGTRLFADGGGGSIYEMVTFGDNVYYRDAVGGLYVSDGTTDGTTLLMDFALGKDPQHMTTVGSTLFFQGADTETGRELWRADGGTGVVERVLDILPNSPIRPTQTLSSEPEELFSYNGSLYFTADDYTNIAAAPGSIGRELWTSDGTAEGTALAANIYPGFDPFTGVGYSSEPLHFANLNGTLFFSAIDAAHGRELWKLDAPPAGTPRTVAAGIHRAVPGTTATVPLTIDNADGLSSVFFRFSYDTSLFDFSASNLRLGDLTAGWTVDVQVDDTTGTITGSITSPSPLTGVGGGTLLFLDFATNAAAPLGTETQISIDSIELNGGAVASNTVNGTVRMLPATLNILDVQLGPSYVDILLTDPIDPTVLNLYDGDDVAVDQADLVFEGDQVGVVPGSLSWDATL